MNYYVTREGQQYGPYTLADLQRYVAQGNVSPTDLARSEAMEQWVPVQQILGNIPVEASQAPPVNYGQVPVYAPGAGPAQASLQAHGPVPIGLHWALILLFSVFTCGLFSTVWMFVEASFAHKLGTNSKPLIYYSTGIAAFFVGGLMSAVPELKALPGIINLGGFILLVIGHFSLRSALEDYYNRVEPINLQLSGVMTFFFNVFYFQYHLSRIRDWKMTGVLR